jgi:hypothetical protein
MTAECCQILLVGALPGPRRLSTADAASDNEANGYRIYSFLDYTHETLLTAIRLICNRGSS